MTVILNPRWPPSVNISIIVKHDSLSSSKTLRKGCWIRDLSVNQGAHLSESLGGVGALYAHWRYRAAVVWRVYVGVDRIRAPVLSLLQDGVSAGGVSLEFRGQEMGVISSVNTQDAGVQRRDTPNCPSTRREDVHSAVAQRAWYYLPG